MDFKKANYAITVNPNSKDRVYFKEDIDHIIDDVCNAQFLDVLYPPRYELKQDRTLHAHLAVTGPVGLRYTKCQRKGWQVFVRPMYNGKNWQSYCDKFKRNKILEEHILLSHQYQNKYMFQNTSEEDLNEMEEYYQDEIKPLIEASLEAELDNPMDA